jgi:hypothetical protein
MEALMYGDIPMAKMDMFLKALPVNRSINLKRPFPASDVKASASKPGIAIKHPILKITTSNSVI